MRILKRLAVVFALAFHALTYLIDGRQLEQNSPVEVQ